MSCASFAADLSAWIDRELPAERAAALAAHVDACPACRARVEALRRADGALRAIPLRELSPGALAELARWTSRGARAGPRRAPARVARWLGWSAGAVAAAAALVLYLASRRPDPLDSASPEDLAVAIDLDTAEDLDVIANLEVLEALVAQEGGRG